MVMAAMFWQRIGLGQKVNLKSRVDPRWTSAGEGLKGRPGFQCNLPASSHTTYSTPSTTTQTPFFCLTVVIANFLPRLQMEALIRAPSWSQG